MCELLAADAFVAATSLIWAPGSLPPAADVLGVRAAAGEPALFTEPCTGAAPPFSWCPWALLAAMLCLFPCTVPAHQADKPSSGDEEIYECYQDAKLRLGHSMAASSGVRSVALQTSRTFVTRF